MLKAALLCSVVCTAFVVGGSSSASSQDQAGKVVKPVVLRQVLIPLIGKKCLALPVAGSWTIHFETNVGKTGKLEAVGIDFVRLSSHKHTVYVPFSSIKAIHTD